MRESTTKSRMRQSVERLSEGPVKSKDHLEMYLKAGTGRERQSKGGSKEIVMGRKNVEGYVTFDLQHTNYPLAPEVGLQHSANNRKMVLEQS